MWQEVKLLIFLGNIMDMGPFNSLGLELKLRNQSHNLHLKQRNSRKYKKHLWIDWDWLGDSTLGSPRQTWQNLAIEVRGKIWSTIPKRNGRFSVVFYKLQLAFSWCFLFDLKVTLHLHHKLVPDVAQSTDSTVSTWPEGKERVLCKFICIICMLWSNEIETCMFLFPLLLRLEGWQYWIQYVSMYYVLVIEIERWHGSDRNPEVFSQLNRIKSNKNRPSSYYQTDSRTKHHCLVRLW